MKSNCTQSIGEGLAQAGLSFLLALYALFMVAEVEIYVQAS